VIGAGETLDVDDPPVSTAAAAPMPGMVTS
jgi:hypothetical protein